jgi:hypothetical protein
VAASPAEAVIWHPISGTTFSNTDWYCSSNVRTTSAHGALEAYFTSLPTGSGLRFGVANWQNCSVLSYSDFSTLNNSQEIGFLDSNTQFKNIFRRLTSCQAWYCSHTFGGQELY